MQNISYIQMSITNEQENTQYNKLEKCQRILELSHTRLKKKLQADIEAKHLQSISVWPEYCLIKAKQ